MAHKTVDLALRILRSLVGKGPHGIDDAKYWLWHGFSSTAISDLNAILQNPKNRSSTKASAAFELARWFCGLREYEAAQRYLRLCDHRPRGRKSFRIRFTKVQAEVIAAVGSEFEKENFIDDHFFESDVEFHLALANVARTTERVYPELDPVETLNRAYISNRLSPIKKISEELPHSIDNLTSRNAVRSSVPADELVSIIMPTWQAASTVETAMRGLAEQSYPNLEVIVVDDASEDGTADVVEAFTRNDKRFRLVRSPDNIGSYACRNLALAHVRGDFVTVQDADDWSHPEKIASQVSHLQRSDAPYNLAMWVRTDNELRFRSNDVYSSRLIGPDHSSAMFRSAILEKSGGWDNVRISADTELMWRIETSFGRPHGTFKSRRVLANCPLSIGRIEEKSLTRLSQTHISTIRFGVRSEYRDAAAHWHDKFATHKTKGTLERHETLFPVPSFIKSMRRNEPDPDFMIIADFHSPDLDHQNFRLLRAIVEARQGHCAIFHYPDYEAAGSVSISAPVRGYAWEHGVRIVVAGEHLSAEHALIPDVTLLRYPLDNPPKLTTKDAKLADGRRGDASRAANPETIKSLLKRNAISVQGETGIYISPGDLLLDVQRLSHDVTNVAESGERPSAGRAAT